MKRLFSAALAAALCVGAGALAPHVAQAAPLFEPDASWTTLETKHFRIYYTAPFASKARQIAAIAEDAYVRVTPYMRVKPNGPVEVVISDSYDELNSMATDSPHTAVWLWMTPPNPDEGMWIGRYDQWMRLLFVHEFTHILQFKQTPAWIAHVNSALGGLLLSAFPTLPIDITLNLPDLLSNPPAFVMEGQAVYAESTFTPGGRMTEGDFDMIRRMAFLEHKEPTLDQVWGRYLLDWPMGGYEYTWGNAFVAYVSRTRGPDAIVSALKNYGQAPWLGFDVAFQRALGTSTQRTWDAMVAEARQVAFRDRARYQARRARETTLPTPTAVTSSGRYHRHPVWDRNGHLLYLEALYNKGPRLIDDALDGRHRTTLMPKSTRSAVSLDARSHKIYFEQDTSDTPKGLTAFREIFVYDRDRKTSKRLTHNARAYTPTVSPDGQRIAAVTSGGGKSGIGIFDVTGKRVRQWRYDNNDYQFGNPVWSPDGHMLAVAIWEGGSRDLWLLNPDTGEKTRLWQDKAVDFYPSWSPDGRQLVFTSDRSSGTFNLFAYDLGDGTLRQLTDELGGAFDPVVSPDGKTLAFVTYSGRGYDVATQPFEPMGGLAAATPPRAATLPIAVSAALPQPETIHLGGYNPLATMTPSIWFPVLGQDELGSNLSIYTFWQDILRYHALTVIGGYGFNSQRVGYGFRYENNQLPFQWSVGLNEYPDAGRYPADPQGNAFGNLWQWNKQAYLSFSYPSLRNPMFDPPPIEGDNWTVGLKTSNVQDYAFQADAQNSSTPPLQPVLTGHPAFPTARDQGPSNSVYVEWQRASHVKHSYDPVPETGQITTLGLEQGIQGVPLAGPVQPYTRLWADHIFYQPLPWGDRHTLAVRGTAGALYGRNGEFYYSIWRAPFGYEPLSTVNRWDLTTATAYDNRYVLLRGYPFVLGNREVSLGVEYRVPIAEVKRGWGQVFLNRIYGLGFLDSGFFWGTDPSQLALPGLADFKSGLGAELRFQTTMFQAVPVDVRVGGAVPLTAIDQTGSHAPQYNVGLGTTF